MNAMRKFTMTGLFAAAALAAAVAVAAPPAGPGDGCGCPGPRHHGWHGWHRPGPGRWLHGLNLTGSQRQSVHAILDGARGGMRDLHEQMRSNMMKLAASTPDAPDHAALVGQISRVDAALFGQMIEKREDVRAKIYALLTPAQKKQLDERRARMAAHRAHGRDCGPAHGDAPSRD